jgi:hypothetical protein
MSVSTCCDAYALVIALVIAHNDRQLSRTTLPVGSHHLQPCIVARQQQSPKSALYISLLSFQPPDLALLTLLATAAATSAKVKGKRLSALLEMHGMPTKRPTTRVLLLIHVLPAVVRTTAFLI